MAKDKSFIAPKFGEIINARPKNMSFEKYKKLRKEQTKRLKARLTGFYVWKSQCLGIVNPSGQRVPGGEAWGTLVGHVPTVRIK